MFDVPDPVQSLRCIDAWMRRNHPDRQPFLRAGADPGSVLRLEHKLGVELPSDVRLLYATHDGQPEGAPYLYLNQRWLPLGLVDVAWEDLCLRYSSLDQLAPEVCRYDWSICQTKAWTSNWLPIFSSSRGDHYCVDLQSENSERYGQIIWFLYDRPERTGIAPNLRQLLWRVADGLKAGIWRLDDGYDGLSD